MKAVIVPKTKDAGVGCRANVIDVEKDGQVPPVKLIKIVPPVYTASKPDKTRG